MIEAELAAKFCVGGEIVEIGDGDAADEGGVEVEVKIAGGATADVVPTPVAGVAGGDERERAFLADLLAPGAGPAVLMARRN